VHRSRVINDDMPLKAYKKDPSSCFNCRSHRQKKVSHWIKNRFTKVSGRNILFSDEKVFDQDDQYNRQNDRVYAESRQAAT
jgi:hypothetical protein